MKYYLSVSEELLEQSVDLFTNRYLLVESAFDNIYAKQGFQVFERIIEDETLVEHMEIMDEHGEEISIGDFIEILEEKNFHI